MHEIQTHILKKLLVNETLSYSKIKPADITGNLFSYHLNKLLSGGVITKNNGRYTLTSKGKRYASRLSVKTMTLRVQPKIVIEIVCRNNNGEYLFFKQKRQPFIGLLGFPYGKIHLGEKIKDAAKRELKEKTGLDAAPAHRGEVYSSVYEKGELISHILIHVFSCRNPKGDLVKENENGEYFWGKIVPPFSKFMPSTVEISNLLKKNPRKRFFLEIVTKKRAR